MRSIQFIVPTLKRVDFLKKCLDSLLKQTIKPDKIFVGIREDDIESAALVESYTSHSPVYHVKAEGVGVVGSMTSCLSETHSDFVALVDDDVELPSEWSETMLIHLNEYSDVVGSAGRDVLQDHPEMRRSEPLTLDVGRIHWYGRITGNHHRGGGLPRKVQVLRGSNILFRGNFLREAGFEQQLWGQGAQVNWELALAFQAAQKKQALFFDPTVQVIHHTAPRHDNDLVHRGIFNKEGIMDMSYNEAYVTWKHAPCRFRFSVIAWQWLVGSRPCPGIINMLRNFLAFTSNGYESFKAASNSRWLAFRSRTTHSNVRSKAER